MNEFLNEALGKLDAGVKSKMDRYGEAMKKSVRGALAEFCRQDGEFAQAVVQGGSFENCMKAVAKGVSGTISDLEAYRRAVRFFFPGADIKFRMTIDLCASASEAEPESGRDAILIDLTDFF